MRRCLAIWIVIPSLLPAADPAAVGRRDLWSLRPIVRPAVPSVRPSVENGSWPRTPVDTFILAKLDEKGLAPSAEASKSTLIRRATLDLTGIPPSPEEVEPFLADESPDAYERLVERLLDSPRYGERWGRHWLDLARFAESEGFKSDEIRPHAWRYRDYVIESLTSDKPYDRFIQEQIAGDELWPGDLDARVATAFNRHYPDESNARDLFQRRQEILNDVTDTVGHVFLGLTYECARCHDHKHDPILQADYYRLQAFFAGMRAVDDLVLAPEETVRAHRAKLAVWEERTESLRAEMGKIEEAKRRQIADDNFEKFPAEIQSAILKPDAERTPIEWQMFHKARPYLYPDRRTITAGLSGDMKKKWEALDRELAGFADLFPGELPLASAIADVGPEAPKTFLLKGGSHNAPGAEVSPGFLTAIDPRPAAVEPPQAIPSSGRRASLARWLTDRKNPLTARVIANRLWHYHFGRGIAGTPSDFGYMGGPPSHPELLDWLATELVRGGWRLKPLHRLIVTSSVYRQSSSDRGGAQISDADNSLLSRYPRSRLEGEAIRDSALAAAGLLDVRMGGPSVFPPLPRGMEESEKWMKTRKAGDENRRSIYIFVRRNLRYPLFEVFDAPDTHLSCGRRSVTVTAPQALHLLNGDLALSWARGFAARVEAEAGADLRARVERAYRIAFSRSPESCEMDAAAKFIDRQRPLTGEKDPARADAAALADFCHALINSNEFVYKD